jgi:hypothetical protein
MANETLIADATGVVVKVADAGGGFNAAFDKFLSVVIPIAIFGMFFYMMYTAFQDPIDRLIAWIKDKWGNMNSPDEVTSTPRYSGIILDSRAEIYK